MLQESLLFFFLVDGAKEGIVLNVIPKLPMQQELCLSQYWYSISRRMKATYLGAALQWRQN